MPERKLRPKDPQWLSPPNDDFPFFDGGLTSAFQHDATDYSPVNAACLADASLLAYSDPDVVKACFARQAAPEGELAVITFAGGSTQGYVAYDAKKAIVAFRGTQVLKPRAGHSSLGLFPEIDADRFQEVAKDWLTDLNVRTVLDPKFGGVHAGFLSAFENVWLENSKGSGLATILGGLTKDQTRTVWFTGHSLGGALATLAAFWYDGKSTLYTFGSPRVGNAAFRARFGDRSGFRFTHATDIVPTVPHIMCHAGPTALESFEHVGRHYVISTSSTVSESSEPARQTQWPGYFNVAANTLKALGTEWMSALPQQRIADHAPTYYASLLWNALPR